MRSCLIEAEATKQKRDASDAGNEGEPPTTENPAGELLTSSQNAFLPYDIGSGE